MFPFYTSRKHIVFLITVRPFPRALKILSILPFISSTIILKKFHPQGAMKVAFKDNFETNRGSVLLGCRDERA